MFRSRDWLVLALIAAVVCLYLAIKPLRPSAQGTRHPAVGLKLDYLELQPLTGDSQKVSLTDLEGHVVLLNFWGTWCGPCVQEFPHIIDLVARYSSRSGFRLLAVSCGGETDDELDELRDSTQSFLQSMKSILPTYADQHGSTRQNLIRIAHLEGFGYPTTLVLDRKAVIRAMWEGYSPATVQEMQAVVGKLLNEADPSGKASAQ